MNASLNLTNINPSETGHKFCVRCDEWLVEHDNACVLTYADGSEPICVACTEILNVMLQDFMATSPQAMKVRSQLRALPMPR